MDSALEILLFLVGVSLGLFVLISLLVLVPGRRSARRAAAGPVWFGGPAGSEHGASTSGPVLTDPPPRWAAVAGADWVTAAETAEPGRRIGGASVGWRAETRALTPQQADDVRHALTVAERRSGLRFGLFLGEPVGGRRHFAEKLHAALGAEAAGAVVLFVDVKGCALEIVTGENAGRRIPDAVCGLTAMSMATSFGVGDLAGGLLNGIGALAEQATARR